MLNVILVSDLHYDGTTINPDLNLVPTIINNCNAPKNVVLVAGDITSNGFDGKVTNKCCFRCCTSNSWATGGSEINELQLFKDKFATPISSVKNTEILLAHGNHDEYNGAGRFPVLDYIEDTYGDLYYVRQISGVYFFMCGKYPTQEICEWITTQFIKNKIQPETPLIFSFHYNLFGDYSSWWTDEEKEIFYKTICNCNVLAIAVGHLHESYEGTFKNILVISGAGNKIAQLIIDDKFNRTVKFIDF